MCTVERASPCARDKQINRLEKCRINNNNNNYIRFRIHTAESRATHSVCTNHTLYNSRLWVSWWETKHSLIRTQTNAHTETAQNRQQHSHFILSNDLIAPFAVYTIYGYVNDLPCTLRQQPTTTQFSLSLTHSLPQLIQHHTGVPQYFVFQ